MKVALSGRAAAALVLDGDVWFRIDAERPTEKQPSGPHDWSYVFGVVQDIQYVDAGSYDEIESALVAAVDVEHALALAMICLDRETTDDTRKLAAHDLEEILVRTPAAKEFVWKILSSKPLPPSASFDHARVVTRDESFRFFELLEKCQPAISVVRDTWELIPDEELRGLDSEQVLAFAVHAGITADLVAAIHSSSHITARHVEPPPEWPSDIFDSLVRKWAALIEDAAAPVVAIMEREEAVAASPWIEPPTLFTAGDPDAEVLQKIDFDGSLINNLLFRRSLLIADTDLFGSEGVRKHMQRENTLLEAGIAAGLITCACSGADFAASYSALQHDGLVLPACPYVDRLQDAAEHHGARSLIFRQSEHTSKLSEKHLLALEAKAPPASAQSVSGGLPLMKNALTKQWEATQQLRTTVITEARESSLREGRPGVGKRALFRALVTVVLGTGADVLPLAEFLDKVGKKLGRQIEQRVRVFWSWTSEGYRFSDASTLGALVYSPGYDKLHNIFVTAALGSFSGSDTVSVEVKMPSTEVLKRVPAIEIIHLRRGPGTDYLNAIADWHRQPERKRPVEEALQRYANEIAKVAKHYASSSMSFKIVEMNVVLPKTREGNRTIGQQFTSMTTFENSIQQSLHRVLPGGKVGIVSANDQTDIVVNDVM